MVFTNRHKKRGRLQGLREEREAWVAWLRRKEEAEATGQPFYELNPAEKSQQERRR